MSRTRANTGNRRRNKNQQPEGRQQPDHSGFKIDGTSKEELEVALRLQKLQLGTDPPCPAADMDLSCPTDKKSAKRKFLKLHPDRNKGCEKLAGWMSGKYGSTCYGDKEVHSKVRWDSKDKNQVNRESQQLNEISRLQRKMEQNMASEFGVTKNETSVPSHCSPKKVKKASGVVGRYCENPDVTDKLCECRPGSPANERVTSGLSRTTDEQIDMGRCQSAVDPSTGKPYYYHGSKTTWDPNDPICQDQPMLKDRSKSKPSLKSAANRVIAKKQASRVGETVVGSLANTRKKHGDTMVKNVKHHGGNWEQGTVAADSLSWAGEKFAYNTATGEYIIWSQKVTQDDCGNKGICANPSAAVAESCSRCIWVLYPSVKYGTEDDSSGKHFANVPGQFWYYNKNKGKWRRKKPKGVEFDQIEIASVTKKLYGSKSHAMDELKRKKKQESSSKSIDEEKKIQINMGISTAAGLKEEEINRFAIFDRFMNPKVNKIKQLDTNNVLDYFVF